MANFMTFEEYYQIKDEKLNEFGIPTAPTQQNPSLAAGPLGQTMSPRTPAAGRTPAASRTAASPLNPSQAAGQVPPEVIQAVRNEDPRLANMDDAQVFKMARGQIMQKMQQMQQMQPSGFVA